MRILVKIWAIVMAGIGISTFDNGDTGLAILAMICGLVPLILMWKSKSLGSTINNPYMDMRAYTKGMKLPEVRYNGIPMEKEEYPFYAVPAHRYRVGKQIQAQTRYIQGTYLVTNKRVCFVSSEMSFGERIEKLESVKISGDMILLKIGNDIYYVGITKGHVGYGYGFTHAAMGGLEPINYGIASLPQSFMKNINKRPVR